MRWWPWWPLERPLLFRPIYNLRVLALEVWSLELLSMVVWKSELHMYTLWHIHIIIIIIIYYIYIHIPDVADLPTNGNALTQRWPLSTCSLLQVGYFRPYFYEQCDFDRRPAAHGQALDQDPKGRLLQWVCGSEKNIEDVERLILKDLPLYKAFLLYVFITF